MFLPIFSSAVLVTFLIFSGFCILWSGKFKDTALATLWASLLTVASVFRILLEIVPMQAALLSRSIILFLFCSTIFLLVKNRKKITRLKFSWQHLPYLLALLFLYIRNYFPCFDVDSLTYHLAGLEWMCNKNSLPPFQQELQNISIWFSWISVEESLSIPGLGLNLPFFAGLMAGAMKLLAVSTVILLVPRKLPLLRTLVAFFFLIDDHFFFSCQSRFVYINPLLIGITPLVAWFTWRGLRGSNKYAFLAIASAIGLFAIKYHGIYIGLPLLFITVVSIASRMYGKSFSWKDISTSSWLIMLGFCISTIPIFFFHWFFRGSPVFPFSLGPFHSSLQNRGIEIIEEHLRSKKAFTSVIDFFRFMIYPQNLAIKIATFLWVPSIFALMIKNNFFQLRNRNLWLAAICLSATALWCSISHHIAYVDSRYPRYIFGTTVLGLIYLLLSLRKAKIYQSLALGVIMFISTTYFFSFIENKMIRYPIGIIAACFMIFGMYFLPSNSKLRWRMSPQKSIFISWLLILILFLSIDSRQYNILRTERPNWKKIWLYLTEEKNQPIDTFAASFNGLLRPIVNSDIIPMRDCMRAQESILNTRLVFGENLIIFGPDSVWPSLLLGPAAVQGAVYEGGGYIHLDKSTDFITQNILYALVPLDGNIPYSNGGPSFIKNDGTRVPLLLEEKTLCKTQALGLFKIRAD